MWSQILGSPLLNTSSKKECNSLLARVPNLYAVSQSIWDFRRLGVSLNCRTILNFRFYSRIESGSRNLSVATSTTGASGKAGDPRSAAEGSLGLKFGSLHYRSTWHGIRFWAGSFPIANRKSKIENAISRGTVPVFGRVKTFLRFFWESADLLLVLN